MKKGKITFLGNLPEWLRRTIAGVLIAALIGGGVYGILLLVRGSGGPYLRGDQLGEEQQCQEKR